MTSETLDKISPAWVAALNELTDVARSETADTGSYKYKYATLAAAAQQARTVLGKHELAVFQSSFSTGLGSVAVTTRVIHTSGQWIESDPLVMPAKGGPQDVGSALTYGRRYGLMSFLGLATDDDDGVGAQTAHAKPEPVHPLSERVSAVQADMRKLTDTSKETLKVWADGRKLTPNSMLADERWLGYVEDWLAENQGAA
jgi:hypothetical protein